MSMSVGPVSSVNFRGIEMLERPGKYSNPINQEIADVPEKKKMSTGRKVFIRACLAIAAASALVGLQASNVVKKLAPEALKDAKLLDKASHYIATAGEFISKYTYDKIMPLFRKAAK